MFNVSVPHLIVVPLSLTESECAIVAGTLIKESPLAGNTGNITIEFQQLQFEESHQ